MANTASAQKQARQNEKRRLKNLARRTALKTAVKKTLTAIATHPDAPKTLELLKDVAAKCARAKNKHVMHRNTAARKLSRLTKKLNKARAQQQQAPATAA